MRISSRPLTDGPTRGQHHRILAGISIKRLPRSFRGSNKGKSLVGFPCGSKATQKRGGGKEAADDRREPLKRLFPDVADAAAEVGDVAGIAGNDVEMADATSRPLWGVTRLFPSHVTHEAAPAVQGSG